MSLFLGVFRWLIDYLIEINSTKGKLQRKMVSESNRHMNCLEMPVLVIQCMDHRESFVISPWFLTQIGLLPSIASGSSQF